MGEKQYGGASNFGIRKQAKPSKSPVKQVISEKTKEKLEVENNISGIENYMKAGKIAKEVIAYARQIIKPGLALLEIAEKIENKILALGGKPAFPVNLSINDIAAHYTPSHEDKTKASGLLKVDLGVHVEGCIVDTAFSIDLENLEESKKLIEASEKALQEAIKAAKQGAELWKIGEAIQNTITSFNFSPVRNLSGHELGLYNIHAGLTIPNCNNNNNTKLPEGAFAIEPFATKGQGIVYEGKPSGIYRFEKTAAVRDILSREIQDFIQEEYQTLPFCSRWLVKKFGTRALLSLSLLEKAQALHQYPQLIEKSHQPVSQAETTILVTDKVEVLA